MTLVVSGRKHFLDWLRVLAFGFLILFHIGLLYVSWPYNLKSPRLFPELEWAMVALNPWRLSLLFFVSGVASRHLLLKLQTTGFVRDRLRRLLPVLLVGMLIIIPPQTFVELSDKGLMQVGYVEFWLHSYLGADPSYGIIMPRWDHLWFLVYLVVYLCLFSLGLLVFQNYPYLDEKSHFVLTPFIAGPAIWLAGANVLESEVFPLTHALANDWAAHLRWGGVFFLGVLLARHDRFWECVRAKRLWFALTAGGLLLVQWHVRLDVLNGTAPSAAYAGASGLYAWFVILAVLGYAARWVNSPSSLLTYLNTAILPVYVFHQPAMLVAAYMVFPIGLPLGLEVSLLITAALGVPLVIYEIAVRRIGILRFSFGLKPLSQSAV